MHFTIKNSCRYFAISGTSFICIHVDRIILLKTSDKTRTRQKKFQCYTKYENVCPRQKSDRQKIQQHNIGTFLSFKDYLSCTCTNGSSEILQIKRGKYFFLLKMFSSTNTLNFVKTSRLGYIIEIERRRLVIPPSTVEYSVG